VRAAAAAGFVQSLLKMNSGPELQVEPVVRYRNQMSMAAVAGMCYRTTNPGVLVVQR